MIKTVGSVCSGIEAATVAWEPLGFKFQWLSEIATFPTKVLAEKYPSVPNVGDMNNIPDLIREKSIDSPDLICGGTPCQAFSYAGWQNGLNDDRGNLTLKFVDIINANDERRLEENKDCTIVFWENVEGVLSDKTNAFGCMISSMAGLSEVLEKKRWPNAGLLRGPKRNVAWRVLDAKYFGVPQQRKRLYVLAGGKDFNPENILFEEHKVKFPDYPTYDLVVEKDGHKFEAFRSYTDCLYSAYGTKWNGNAAAYNGSLFIVQDERIRRISPIECERLMGFPEGYTDISSATRTTRYQALGNSWAVPVVKWIGQRMVDTQLSDLKIIPDDLEDYVSILNDKSEFYDFGKDSLVPKNGKIINCTSIPEKCKFKNLLDILSPDAPEEIYISPVGCNGIVRRKQERNLSINLRLEEVLISIASQMSPEEIEKRSRVQKRGRFSN
ncbi:MAG: DNA cytosine methyltransferase [Lachnospiraceae bacterium]|jgi:DNA (cytosine-5)-methyltransferase 1|uniref:DNA cytosine methyltransferase n=1 Tax=Faecalicatena contorta TaxID=39482 RepID=UPI001F18ED1C|nr:DNA cytosine methyltransferase [Faecalicatena contorta]MCF2680557.1 DNA cytosine methyltransferase [Faecalicatena contorta]MDD7436539.1 DNA cytosine methyltransferase [Lachnospiraceae bacterium]MDY4771779.1 DNA cytosine methyltransferase [Lachnospiraceae bacterium]